MWLIFLTVCIAVALAAAVVAWICNKLYIAMQKDIRKFQKEQEKERKSDE